MVERSAAGQPIRITLEWSRSEPALGEHPIQRRTDVPGSSRAARDPDVMERWLTPSVEERAMEGPAQSRRDFIATLGASGAAWLALQAPLLASLGACARDAALRDEPFTFLTVERGRALSAVADRIIPAVDGLPGAKEAGAVHFVDLALFSPSPVASRTASPTRAEWWELTSCPTATLQCSDCSSTRSTSTKACR
jgi:hypothetical protein